jgi:hypothetical protein
VFFYYYLDFYDYLKLLWIDCWTFRNCIPFFTQERSEAAQAILILKIVSTKFFFCRGLKPGEELISFPIIKVFFFAKRTWKYQMTVLTERSSTKRKNTNELFWIPSSSTTSKTCRWRAAATPPFKPWIGSAPLWKGSHRSSTPRASTLLRQLECHIYFKVCFRLQCCQILDTIYELDVAIKYFNDEGR